MQLQQTFNMICTRWAKPPFPILKTVTLFRVLYWNDQISGTDIYNRWAYNKPLALFRLANLFLVSSSPQASLQRFSCFSLHSLSATCLFPLTTWSLKQLIWCIWGWFFTIRKTLRLMAALCPVVFLPCLVCIEQVSLLLGLRSPLGAWRISLVEPNFSALQTSSFNFSPA